MNKLNKIRRKNAQIYKRGLKGSGIIFQKTEAQTNNAFFYLTGLLPQELKSKRNDFLIKIKKAGVPIKNLYPLSLPELKLLKKEKYDNCPVANDLTKRLFNLYVKPGLEEKNMQFVVI